MGLELNTLALAKKYTNGLADKFNGSPKAVFATLAALQTAYPTGVSGTYLVKADGNWYYWDTAWTAGGVYQSSVGVLASSDIINDLATGGATKVASADTVKTLNVTKVNGTDVVTNAQTDGINTKMGHATNAIADDVSTSVILGGGSTNYNNIIGGDGSLTVGTLTPNAVSAGTTANVSVVAGYDNVAGSLSSKIISDHSYTEVGGLGHNAIYGGASHVVKNTANFAIIAGGNSNVVSGGGAFVTGIRNDVGGAASCGFGQDNVVTGPYDFVTGANNVVSGSYAQAHGTYNQTVANYSKAEGYYARTSSYAQQALAGGRFTAVGDAQTSVIPLFRLTTSATVVYLGILNSNLSYMMEFNKSVSFTALVIARDAASTDSSGWEVKGVMCRGATGSSLPVGTPTITNIGASAGAATWVISSIGGDATGSINIKIAGETGKNIRWMCRLTISEVMVDVV